MRTNMNGSWSSKAGPLSSSREKRKQLSFARLVPEHSGSARHRVVWTDPDRKTVWLAIHYRT